MTDEIRNDNLINETECETRADNAQNEVVIEIRHLGKSFGDHEVLKDIDFTVRRGDAVTGARARASYRRFRNGVTSAGEFSGVAETEKSVFHIDRENGFVHAGHGETQIFIYPGYKFKILKGMITNFHLPESTLIMYVCAFAGYENVMNMYKTAVDMKYRFFSFGDATLLI